MFASTASSGKVKFIDEQLDDYVLENAALQSKLKSKIEALVIMSRELDKCSMERDRYKLLVEALKAKYPTHNSVRTGIKSIYKIHNPSNTISGGELLAETREQNKVLKLEVETLRSKLEEARGDINVLRRSNAPNNINGHSKEQDCLEAFHNEKEELLQNLELVKKRCEKFEADYRAVLDEKDELLGERDFYKNQVNRLNYHMKLVTDVKSKGDSDRSKDCNGSNISALISENKYLQEQIIQLQGEKELIKKTLGKYKAILENKQKNGISLENGHVDVMTQKQVKKFLHNISPKDQKMLATTIGDMKSLSLGLLESLNDKTVALNHQRKTNRILALRIAELEKTINDWSSNDRPALLTEHIPELDRSSSSSNIGNADICSGNEASLNGEQESTVPESITEETNDKAVVNVHIPITKSNIILPPELKELIQESISADDVVNN